MSEPKKPRRVSKAERRRHILQHARRVFRERGYGDTSPVYIAESAQLSLATLQRHFPTPIDLLRGIIRELRQATLERWQEETAELPDPLVKLHAVAERYLRALGDLRSDFEILHGVIRQGGAEETLAVRAYYLDFEAFLTQLIGEGQQSGVFRRNLDPRIGAWELLHSALGRTITAPLAMPLHQEQEYVTRAVDCLLHALLKVDV
jgi:TetR/AcrR family fatty acid metabolism transcriptional regulator